MMFRGESNANSLFVFWSYFYGDHLAFTQPYLTIDFIDCVWSLDINLNMLRLDQQNCVGLVEVVVNMTRLAVAEM